MYPEFEYLDGKTTWKEYQDEDDYSYEKEVFRPDYKSDKNIKRVAGLVMEKE